MSQIENEKTFHFDWNTDEDDADAFFWVAWVDEPALPEPYCYGNGVHYFGLEAIAHIEKAQSLSGVALSAHMRAYLVAE
jgi:hypothetical protein